MQQPYGILGPRLIRQEFFPSEIRLKMTTKLTFFIIFTGVAPRAVHWRGCESSWFLFPTLTVVPMGLYFTFPVLNLHMIQLPGPCQRGRTRHHGRALQEAFPRNTWRSSPSHWTHLLRAADGLFCLRCVLMRCECASAAYIYIHTYICMYVCMYVCCIYIYIYIWYTIIALVALNLEKLLLFLQYLAVQLASKLAEAQLFMFEA